MQQGCRDSGNGKTGRLLVFVALGAHFANLRGVIMSDQSKWAVTSSLLYVALLLAERLGEQ